MASLEIPEATLAAIERHFHALIQRVASEYVDTASMLDLPRIASLVERSQFDDERAWFPVPGMYGGFSFRLEGTGAAAKLIVDSWSRVVGGSELTHEITSQGVKLVGEGFN